MASNSEFIIKCKTENGSFVMKTVNSESTVQELKMHLSDKTDLKPECIKILCGYPPKALTDDANSLKLQDVNIRSGETVIVERKNVTECGATRSEVYFPTSSEAVINEVKQGKELPLAAENPTSSDGAEPYSDFLSGGIMMRHVVPSNNSCLFASVYFVLSNGDLNPEKSTELRKLIARVVSENPEKYTAAFLGMPNKDYCAWIQNADHWGGAIELSILSEHFRLEIVAVDTISLKMHRFGENCDYTNIIFLIYDGIHYDPLVLELDSAPMQTIFQVNDDRPMEMAMEIAREAKSSKQYTDIANFTLRCSLCDLKLRGDKEAREHATATGHVEFGEILK